MKTTLSVPPPSPSRTSSSSSSKVVLSRRINALSSYLLNLRAVLPVPDEGVRLTGEAWADTTGRVLLTKTVEDVLSFDRETTDLYFRMAVDMVG